MQSFLTNKGRKKDDFGLVAHCSELTEDFHCQNNLNLVLLCMVSSNSHFKTCCNYEEGAIKARMNKLKRFVQLLMKGRLFSPSTGGCVHVHLGSVGKLDPTGNNL